MPKEFPCVVVIFSEYMGFMCGYIPLYAVHYLEDYINKDNFDKDEYLKAFIKRTNHGRPLVNQWTHTNLDVTALMDWKWDSLIRPEDYRKRKTLKKNSHLTDYEQVLISQLTNQ